MYSGSSDGEGSGGHEAAAAPKKIPSASSMPWVRNLRRFVGSGAGLGSEALMGLFPSLNLVLIPHYHLSFFLLVFPFESFACLGSFVLEIFLEIFVNNRVMGVLLDLLHFQIGEFFMKIHVGHQFRTQTSIWCKLGLQF